MRPQGEARQLPGSAALVHLPEQHALLAVAGPSVSVWDLRLARRTQLEGHQLWWGGRSAGGRGEGFGREVWWGPRACAPLAGRG